MSLCIIAPCKDSSPGPARDSLVTFAADYTFRRGEKPKLVSSWQSSNIAAVRNMLASRAISERANWFLWVDDDIVFTTNDACALIDAGEDVVSGCYAKKKLGSGIVSGHTVPGPDRQPLLEVEKVGFGFLAMRRSVLEQIVCESPFTCSMALGQMVGEDDSFSAWWRTRGGRLWLHTGVNLGHVGQHVFQGNAA